jgi:hypothetical protein
MMNEEMEQFEERLRRQPVKQVPSEWRAEILRTARAAGVNRREEEASREITFAATGGSWLSTISHQLSTLLWPHPKAWAGLAAVWVCIFTLNFSMREKPAVLAEKTPAPSPEIVSELKQQQRMLAELIGAPEMQVADRQRLLAPKPRSGRTEILAG